MSDELHKYPGNLKHHKVDAQKREPLLSDKDLLQSESREPHFEVRNIYEATRAKDAELIQRLVDELAEWMQPDLDERFRGEQWSQSRRILDAAAAAGYKPTQAE